MKITKNQKVLILGIVITLIIVTISLLTFFLFRRHDVDYDTVSYPVSATISLPTSDSEKFKKYANTEIGYEYLYSEDVWTFASHREGYGLYPKNHPYYAIGTVEIVTIFAVHSDQSPKEWSIMYNGTGYHLEESRIINGYNGYYIEKKLNGNNQIIYVLSNNNTIVQVVFREAESNIHGRYDNSVYGNEVEKIVQSIRIFGKTQYINQYLPNFSIQYPENWQLSIKDFNDVDPNGFESNYFPSCHERCMGLKLSKGNVSLEMVFDAVYDYNHGRECSHTADFQKLDNDWYRIKEAGEYYYSYNIQSDVTITADNGYGLNNNVWTTKEGTYKICKGGFAQMLKGVSPLLEIQSGILMENPIIKGNPSAEDLMEIDEIVNSIDLGY